MKNFSKTIILPSTKFSMKANLSETENTWMAFWEKNKIYHNLKNKSQKKDKFILKV